MIVAFENELNHRQLIPFTTISLLSIIYNLKKRKEKMINVIGPKKGFELLTSGLQK